MSSRRDDDLPVLPVGRDVAGGLAGPRRLGYEAGWGGGGLEMRPLSDENGRFSPSVATSPRFALRSIPAHAPARCLFRRLAQHLHRDGAFDDPPVVDDEGWDPRDADPRRRVVIAGQSPLVGFFGPGPGAPAGGDARRLRPVPEDLRGPDILPLGAV